MNILPWRRHDELEVMRNRLDGLFGRLLDLDGGPLPGSHLPEVFVRRGLPPVNMSEEDESLCIEVELPGMAEEDIDVQVVGGALVVSGERQWKEEKKGDGKARAWQRVESEYGTFRRVIPLPEGTETDPTKITARYAKGVLRIDVPRIAPAPSRRIEVKHD